MNLHTIFIPMQKISVLGKAPVNEKTRLYYSRIEDIDAKTLIIAAPYSQGFYLPPHPGSKYTGRIAADDCSYIFTIELRDYIPQPIPLWRTTLPVDLKRMQLRGFVRVDVILDVVFQVVSEGETLPAVVTMTKDISASGLRMLLQSPLPPGTMLNITLPLEGDAIIQAVGQVVRVIAPLSSEQKYEVAVRFIKIGEKSRGQIIKYIFRKQIERRKNLNQ